ncbi:MAG: M36 family metallopeptidase [Phaeodactylibacter sp.]|nr:M36 family metallopeptidase [Phaeodactylibacter sp.]
MKVALLAFFMTLTGMSIAQVQTPLAIAQQYLEQNREQLGFSTQDIADLVISDQYTSRHNGVTHLYLNQRHAGIEIYNALMNFNILPNGEVLSVGNRFQQQVAEKVNTTTPVYNASQALASAATHLGLSLPGDVRLIEQTGAHTYVFSGGSLSMSDKITVELNYQALESGALLLAWNLDINTYNSPDHWSMRVDAQTGQVIDKNNFTVHCNADHIPGHQHSAGCTDVYGTAQATTTTLLTDGAKYRVFALPAESPAHGDHILVESPADPLASPYGWHDTDGNDGAEYTITRGNNVHAFYDGDADGAPAATPVDGGVDLVFDFPFFSDQEPSNMIDASITNLFYMNNMMHDISYQFGFTEESGNFQQNNYGNGGSGSDFVNARGQFGGLDPVGYDALNNASFGTPPDGGNGTMTMYHWSTGSRLLEVLSPATIQGSYSVGLADFGPSPLDMPVTGEVVIVDDDFLNPFSTDGCELPFVNADELSGKIAMIDRGGCFFETKASNAEIAGAIAVIICNFEDEALGMAGIADPDPDIPTVSLSSVDCALLRDFVGSGLEVYIGPNMNSGPEYLSADFDNGVIAHEYAHGISNRLTGGPGAAGCLGNGEQMGEGWSDFFALVTSVNAGDEGPDRRGVGTYLIRQGNEGKGIRDYPYSTDIDINPVTYSSAAGASVPHGVGHVWCSMLWDMYWAFSEEYGWSADPTNMTAGNNMAIQLVMDGMKMQPCAPGFVDGRDAILEADVVNFGGENQCLIWEVFARRGLGYFADQGSNTTAGDGNENFDPLPTCIAELKISKSVSPFINAGDEIQVDILVINHKPSTVTNVVVTDEIAAGQTYVDGSANYPATVNGNTVSFELGDMAYEDEITLTYKIATSPDLYSIRYFYDSFEESVIGTWVNQSVGVGAPNEWTITEDDAYTGDHSYFVENINAESQQVLQTLFPDLVQGDNPALRFYHRYNTQAGVDGGIVELSTDIGESWIDLTENMFKNGYDGPIAYSTFVIPNLQAFHGNSDGWIDTYVDITEFADQEVNIRFRFATDETTAAEGWYVDDVELMDVFNYDTEACVMSDEGDMACDRAPNRGTIVESQLPSSVIELEKSKVSFAVFPNPADDIINIQLESEAHTELQVRLFSADGRTVSTQKYAVNGLQIAPINVAHLAEGFYFVEVATENEVAVEKVVLK